MAQPTLLPSGLMDVLPREAAQEFRLIHHFLKTFMGFGYQPVIPPIAEYASSMLAGAGEATAHQVFQVSDPLSPNLLAIRADMTGQVARIATSTLSNDARPLRLCYAGSTLRTTADALKTRREYMQVGIERFGSANANATAEVLAIACHALQSAAIKPLTVDLHYPAVLEMLLAEQPATKHAEIRDAVRLKDPARLHALGAETIAEMMRHAGPAEFVLKKLAASPHTAVKKAATDLEALCQALATHKLAASITIDLLDLSGYGYYQGVGYAIYWNQPGIEVGRGGCYRAASGEEAVGFTLYLNDLLEHLPAGDAPKIQQLEPGATLEEAAILQAQGFVTLLN